MKEINIRVYIITKEMKSWSERRLPGADLALITGPTGRGVVGGEGSIWSLLTLGVVWYVYLVPPPKYSNPTPAGSKSSVMKGSYWGMYSLVMFGAVIGA